jgi:bacterial/archaeal transporter family protein
MANPANRFFWALLAAVFAALTAIFAKVGIRDIDSDLATLIRTIVIVMLLGAFVPLTGKWSNPFALSAKDLDFPCSICCGDRSFLGLLFPCAADR